MKGIILAGGKGTRLYPLTKSVSKQLLPIYDKPLIYYPLSVLMLAGIKEILIISTPQDIEKYQMLLGDGSHIGLEFSYIIQNSPRGLADAFILGEQFIGSDDVCLILGDNFFYGQGFSSLLDKAKETLEGAVIFGYPVSDARPFGVVEFDSSGNVISLEEKPEKPKSNYAVPGLYFYKNNVIGIAKKISPSDRGEIEITAVNNEYLKTGKLKAINMGRGMVWLDTGTPKGILDASNYVHTIQTFQGFYIACIEEIAWRRGYIDREKLTVIADKMKNSEYGKYLITLLGRKK